MIETQYLFHNCMEDSFEVMISTRVLLSNLELNSNIDNYFNPTYVKLKNLRLDKINNIKDKDNIFYKFLKRGPQSIWFPSVETSKEGLEVIYNSIKREIVLFSCLTFLDLIKIKYLLERGIRIVLGGPVTVITTIQELRNLIRENVSNKKSVDENLIIVKGYVDINTDLYKIITEWKDIDLGYRNLDPKSFIGVYSNKSLNFFKQYNNLVEKTEIYSTDIISHIGCPYGKCKFCELKDVPYSPLYEELNVDHIYSNLISLLTYLGTNRLRFFDNYPYEDTKFIDALSALVDKRNVEVAMFAGILKLMDLDSCKFVDKFGQKYKIGVESCIDYVLKYLGKGYDYNGILKAVKNMKDNFSGNKQVNLHLICDLPHNTVNDVELDYSRFIGLKNTLNDSGINAKIYLTPLRVTPRQKYNLFPGMEKANGDFSKSCGSSFMLSKIREFLGLTMYSEFPFRHYVRKDRYGEIMESDFYIVPDLIEEALE